MCAVSAIYSCSGSFVIKLQTAVYVFLYTLPMTYRRVTYAKTTKKSKYPHGSVRCLRVLYEDLPPERHCSPSGNICRSG